MNTYIKTLTDSTFDSEITDSRMPAIVKFGADWCVPCNTMKSLMNNIVPQFIGKIKFAELNVDHSPQKTSEFGIMNIPTILFFDKKGQIVNSIHGSVSKQKLLEKINELVFSL